MTENEAAESFKISWCIFSSGPGPWTNISDCKKIDITLYFKI